MVAWLKALLFAGGGLVAAGGTAYVTGMLDPWLAQKPPVVAALPDTQAPQAPAAPPAASDPAAPSPGDPVTTDKQSRLAPPTFDLLRVEPDGSVLVAGNATAGAQVEVMTDETVLGTSTAGAEGDFVVVLDHPLSPGDYQIVLRATEGDETAISEQTAIVSIPEAAGGQVLAMVEQPGEPARIITAPQAPSTGDSTPQDAGGSGEDVAVAPQPETVAEELAAPAGTDVAAAPDTAAPEEDVAVAPETDAEADVPETAAEAAPEADAAAPEVAAAPETTDEPAAPAVTAEADAAPEVAVAPEPDEPSMPDVAAAPETGDGEAVPEAAAPEVAVAPAEAEPEVDVAAAPEPEAPEVTPQPAVAHQVVVEAVEIDGDTVFVAGFATPGRTVRVYANALYLGDTRASEGGRFLIETKRDLPVGNYVIRADLLERDGTVLARAAVPFEREPGENIAAVAPQGTPPSQAGAEEETIAAAPEAAAPAETVPPEEPGESVAVAPETEPAKVVETPAPATDQPAAPEVAEAPAPATEAPAAPETAEAPAPAGEDKAPVVAAGPQEPSVPAEPAVAAEQPGDAAEPETDEVIASAPPADEPELTGPKLQRVDGAVIIRRGDTLWRISRRVYGRGVRYSTIYLANQDQISDPDRIWPGQVFAVPEETPEGETADMQAIGEQAVPPDTESKIIR